MGDFIKRIAVERAGGCRPSPPRAFLAAAVAGAAAAGVTYRILRS
jgi:hypothetical protein